MHIPQEEWRKLSHQQRRALINKERRRTRRHLTAQKKKEEEEALESDPTYLEKLAEEEQLAAKKEQNEEAQRLLEEELWVEQERRAQEEFKRKRELEEKVHREREERERLIREEWEALERRERAEEERRQKIRREKESSVMAKISFIADRLKEALSTDEKPTTEEPRHNPLAPDDDTNYGTEKDSSNCSFYLKTGACRFGDRCSRNHPQLTSSTTLLIRGMYSSLGLAELMLDERDQDVALEYDEGEMYQHFKEFYEDSLPEFAKAGKVVQFKVSCNYEPHLRGNVYVQYATEEQCAEAYKLFNGRWYAQKQLSCEFCPVQKWKTAICGLFDRRRCPKGKHCNFLHVFRNPGSAFSRANHDFPPLSLSGRRTSGSWSHRRESATRRSRSRERHHSRDRSPSPRRYRSYRSRSRERHHSRDRSLSPRRYRSYRSRSRSRERHGRSDRDRDRRRKGRQKDRRHSNRSRSRSWSRSRERERRSRSHSSSPSDSVSHSPKDPTSKGVRSRSKSPSKDSTKRRKTKSGERSPETKTHRKHKHSHKHKKKRKHHEDAGSGSETQAKPMVAKENETGARGKEHEEQAVLAEECNATDRVTKASDRNVDLEEPGRIFSNAEHHQEHPLVDTNDSAQTQLDIIP